MTQVRSAIQQVIVGQEDVIDGVLTGLLAGGHVLLESVPGLGKTLLIKTLSDVLTVQFTRVQFTPDVTPTDILGSAQQQGPIFTNVLLADEINRAQPKTQAALLEAMQEHRVTLGGVTQRLPQPFLVFATQNPVEQEGTYPLPEAQLDRFLLQVHVPYPSEPELMEIARRTTQGAHVQLMPVLDAAQVVAIQTAIREMPVPESALARAVAIVLATHPDHPSAPQDVKHGVLYGASPRGVQALILAGKVHVVLDGGDTLTVEDIAAVAIPALQHRVLLSFQGAAMGLVTGDLIAAIMEEVYLRCGKALMPIFHDV
jgi:MoxR-like ATPase